MSRIHLLADHLVSQIAAGEVVERPASVVKELLENSLDAGARAVRVELESGGKARILVADDGSGMGSDDALLAFDRHATSKIESFHDLEQVATLGFRGEALATVAAVARVELRTAEAPGAGTRVRIEGGRVLSVEPIALPQGTSVEIRSLFFNVPARRKFLKSTTTELRRCLEVVEGYALAWPEVRFTVSHEGRLLLEAGRVEAGKSLGLRERIGEVLGRQLAERLVEIPRGSAIDASAGEGALFGPSSAAAEGAEGAGEAPVDWCRGFVGRSEVTSPRRLFTWVNRRWVRDRLLNAAFYRAVREEWRSEEAPPLFLFLTIPADEVDVNVHPQKAEVRFRDGGLLDRLVLRLRSALGAARGEVAAPLRMPGGGVAMPFAGEGLGGWWRGAVDSGDSADSVAEQSGQRQGGWVGSAGQAASAGSDGSVGMMPPGEGRRIAEAVFAPLERAPVPLSGRDGQPRPFRLLGQYKGALVLLEGPDGLYLVDQHVAHERIYFERLRQALAVETVRTQTLLEPALLDLPRSERLRLLEAGEELAAAGFEVREIAGEQIGVTALPAALSPSQGLALLAELAARRGEGRSGLRAQLLESFAASLACKAAVKMHEPLGAPQLERLIGELFGCEQPYACPHGRPIVMVLTDADLERRFGRR